MTTIIRVGLALVALWAPASVTAGPITFTVTGHGGLSAPMAVLSDEMFWWADITGDVPSTTYGPTGFTIAPVSAERGFDRLQYGSTLLSTPFTVAENETLEVNTSVFAGLYHAFMINTVGFAVLLEDGVLHSVLSVVRPDGNTWGDKDEYHASPGANVFAAPSAGVITTTITSPGPYFSLGGLTYNDPLAGDSSNTTCGGGPCLTEVHSTLTPGAGTYQLLVGAMGHYTWNTMGVAVKSVTVPEPTTIVMLGVGLGLWIAPRTRGRRK